MLLSWKRPSMIDVNSWMVQYPNFRRLGGLWTHLALLLIRDLQRWRNHAFTVQNYQAENHRCVPQSGCVRVLISAASTGSNCPPSAQQAELRETIQCADQRRVRCPGVGDLHHGKATLPGDGRRAGRCVRRGPDRHRDLQPAWRQVLQEFHSAGVEGELSQCRVHTRLCWWYEDTIAAFCAWHCRWKDSTWVKFSDDFLLLLSLYTNICSLHCGKKHA